MLINRYIDVDQMLVCVLNDRNAFRVCDHEKTIAKHVRVPIV